MSLVGATSECPSGASGAFIWRSGRQRRSAFSSKRAFIVSSTPLADYCIPGALGPCPHRSGLPGRTWHFLRCSPLAGGLNATPLGPFSGPRLTNQTCSFSNVRKIAYVIEQGSLGRPLLAASRHPDGWGILTAHRRLGMKNPIRCGSNQSLPSA